MLELPCVSIGWSAHVSIFVAERAAAETTCRMGLVHRGHGPLPFRALACLKHFNPCPRELRNVDLRNAGKSGKGAKSGDADKGGDFDASTVVRAPITRESCKLEAWSA